MRLTRGKGKRKKMVLLCTFNNDGSGIVAQALRRSFDHNDGLPKNTIRKELTVRRANYRSPKAIS